MGIYIHLLSSVRMSPLAKALARVHYCYESIKYFYEGRFFIPDKIMIWMKAPSEALGGSLKRQVLIYDLHRDIKELQSYFEKRFYTEELFSSIVMVTGTWDLDGMKLAGFISCNNEYSWRRAYFDVEIDAYGKGEVEDLIDALWAKNMIETVAISFTKEMKLAGAKQLAKPREIYFSIGAPEYGEVENLIALHLQDWRDMIRFLYAKLRKEEEPWIKNKVAPIDSGFYISSIIEQKAVQRMFKQIAKETAVIEKSGSSAVYIAKERDSFNKFYNRFKENVFKPASQELPEADLIKKFIKKGLERMMTLS